MLDQEEVPFTLVGEITHWDPRSRHLRIADLDLFLASHVPLDDVAVGLMVLVKGRHDGKSGLRIATVLRRWALA
jgi:hypothetical protein